ncbi:hypothetical protein TAL182_CH03018 [Rhizobium sp. TAL182]|uniref:DUF6362 family protein n=1 Tax=Rhizobium sp. TAL182 TaxID=2020313 RepID=UPI000A2104C4|nr:DUF6362 family protein [Rhizobium sp. TAL182]ARO24763.1 hypothetical protein TAL182_CH03018 [Rhizobium sp. TAL182]
MNYEAWTWKAVETRIIEMADTLRLVPAYRGPKQYGSAMPEVVRRYDEAYGFDASRYGESASAADLARMEEVFGWINSMLDETARKLVYAWSWIKVRKGMKISAFAAENDMNDRMLRRQIQLHCQTIANNLNRVVLVRLNSEDCGLSENEGESDQSDVTSKKCERSAPHWMASDARPILDLESPELAALNKRLEEANRRREREARRRAKLQLEAA